MTREEALAIMTKAWEIIDVPEEISEYLTARISYMASQATSHTCRGCGEVTNPICQTRRLRIDRLCGVLHEAMNEATARAVRKTNRDAATIVERYLRETKGRITVARPVEVEVFQRVINTLTEIKRDLGELKRRDDARARKARAGHALGRAPSPVVAGDSAGSDRVGSDMLLSERVLDEASEMER